MNAWGSEPLLIVFLALESMVLLGCLVVLLTVWITLGAPTTTRWRDGWWLPLIALAAMLLAIGGMFLL